MKGVIIISKFSLLNEDINKVLDKLVSNQNLCKLLYYNDSNPLSQTSLTDPPSLLYSLIFPYPTAIETFKDSDGNPVASSIINVLFDNFKLGTKNHKFKSGDLTFIILSHISLWRLSDSTLRPFCLLNEIDEMFSEQRVIGIGKGEFERCGLIWQDNYSGYKLTYKNYEFA